MSVINDGETPINPAQISSEIARINQNIADIRAYGERREVEMINEILNRGEQRERLARCKFGRGEED